MIFEEAIELMNSINSGKEKIALFKGDDTYPEFITETGYRITVFCDAGDYDYIEEIIGPDGDNLDYVDLYESKETVDLFYSCEPTTLQLRDVWKWKESGVSQKYMMEQDEIMKLKKDQQIKDRKQDAMVRKIFGLK